MSWLERTLIIALLTETGLSATAAVGPARSSTPGRDQRTRAAASSGAIDGDATTSPCWMREAPSAAIPRLSSSHDRALQSAVADSPCKSGPENGRIAV